MIAALKGQIIQKGIDRTILDVMGVGYEILLSSDNLAQIQENDESFFHIHTNVREDAITLYGFLHEEEKELFLLLKTVSGIGPKLSLAMLSGMKVDAICQAIGEGNYKTLTSLQGVGKKTAERICVELKEKVGHLSSGVELQLEDDFLLRPESQNVVADAISALINLGYSDQVARGALKTVKKQLGNEAFDEQQVEILIREALRALV